MTSDGLKQALRLHEDKKFAEAADAYRAVLEHHPNVPGAWTNLGMVLSSQGHNVAAAAAMARAAEIEPQIPAFLKNYGVALDMLDRREEALGVYEQALLVAPGDHNLRRFYGVALHRARRFEEAIVQFDEALRLNPQDFEAQWVRGQTLLQAGRLPQGWNDREAYWKVAWRRKFDHAAPRWNGEDLAGKTILVYRDQGFGNSILFARYIPLLKQRGARVIFRGGNELRRLFEAYPGLDEFCGDETADVAADFSCPLTSLPSIFKTDMDLIPPVVPFHVPPMPEEAARVIEAQRGSINVGIVWSGSDLSPDNVKRSVEARRFLRLAEVPGVRLFGLQKGPRRKDIDDCGGRSAITDLGNYLRDFADTAAVVKRLDLVIMTDSSVAHLAATLGCPVWNLLSYSPYWLYMPGRKDIPWYPSMRLFCQPAPGEWHAVFEQAYAELSLLAAKKQRPGN